MRSAIINVIDRAARKAGRGLVRDFGEVQQLQVSRKGPADFVSAADLKAEKTLRYELGHARPDFGFVGEEGGVVSEGDGSHRWIVDPLNGTTNFLHGIPHFAISVALQRGEDIIAGVVYDPLRDELFWAERNSGAFLNDRRLRVSSRQRLADAVVATGIPFLGKAGHERYMPTLQAVAVNTAGVRQLGSAALDLAYVAAGRCDGFWEFGLGSWDLAAGIILVRESGGFVCDMDGGDKMLAKGEIIATNGELNGPLKTLLKDADPTFSKPSPGAPGHGPNK